MQRIILTVSLFSLLVLGIDCVTSRPLSTISKETSQESLTPISSPGHWDRGLSAAKKEGRLVLYSTIGSEVRAAIVEQFKKTYGIEAEVVLGKGADISQKLLTERRAGLYLADVYFGGPTTLLNMIKPTNALENIEPALLLPEVKDPKVWFGGNLPFLDRDKKAMSFWASPSPPMTLNTDLARPEEVASYLNLLDIRWKGKIIMNDPTVAGSGLSWFQAIGGNIMGLDFIRELAKQEPAIVRDQRQHVEWLVRGKYAIATATKDDVVAEFRRAGANLIEHTPKEGTYLTTSSGNVALMKNSSHPNAAIVFINWLLSKAGQSTVSEAQLIHSARLDVPTDYLDSTRIRNPQVKYLDSRGEDFHLKGPEYTKIASEILGHLIR